LFVHCFLLAARFYFDPHLIVVIWALKTFAGSEATHSDTTKFPAKFSFAIIRCGGFKGAA